MITLPPGHYRIAPRCCQYTHPVVYEGHRRLPAHWSREHDQLLWTTGHGLVSFDGVEFINSSGVRVRISVRVTRIPR